MRTPGHRNNTSLLRLVGLVLIVALALTACASTQPVEETSAPGSTEAPESTEAPDPTEAPGTTETPDTTEAPDSSETTVADSDDSNDAWLIALLILGIAAIGLIIARMARRNPDDSADRSAPPSSDS